MCAQINKQTPQFATEQIPTDSADSFATSELSPPEGSNSLSEPYSVRVSRDSFISGDIREIGVGVILFLHLRKSVGFCSQQIISGGVVRLCGSGLSVGRCWLL